MLTNGYLCLLGLRNGITKEKRLGLIYCGDKDSTVEIMVLDQHYHVFYNEIPQWKVNILNIIMALNGKKLIGILDYHYDMDVFLSETDRECLDKLHKIHKNKCIFMLVFNKKGSSGRYT